MKWDDRATDCTRIFFGEEWKQAKARREAAEYGAASPADPQGKCPRTDITQTFDIGELRAYGVPLQGRSR